MTATHSRQARTAALSERVAGCRTAIDAVTMALSANERQKFTDSLTGLGNRRMFNKALAEIIKTENAVADFAVMVADLDSTGRLNPRDLASNAAKVLSSCLPQGARLCRFDGLRFGILYHEANPALILEAGQRARKALTVYSSGVSAMHRGAVGIPSVGICMYSSAADAFDVVSLAERALQEAQRSGGDVVVFAPEAFHGKAKNLALYGKR